VGIRGGQDVGTGPLNEDYMFIFVGGDDGAAYCLQWDGNHWLDCCVILSNAIAVSTLETIEAAAPQGLLSGRMIFDNKTGPEKEETGPASCEMSKQC
jgi:hypothetical protein